MASATPSFHFEGFEQANTTPIPDVLFDVLLPQLGYAELKVLLYIIRRTRGFKKDTDPISFNQFLRGITTRAGKVLDQGCGIKDRTSLSLALKSLEKKHIIQSTKGIDERGENETTVYCIQWKEEKKKEGGEHPPEALPQKEKSNTDERGEGVVGQPDYPGRATRPPVVGQPYPQETELQQTDLQHRDNSRSIPWNQAQDTPRSHSIEPAPLAALLTKKQTFIEHTKNARFSKAPPPPEVEAAIQDISAKFSDLAHLRENISQAGNLYRAWGGVHGTAFASLVYEASSITRQKGSVRKQMPYFFEVLKSLLGLREGDQQASIAPG